MALVEKLKEIILDNTDRIDCPSVYGLPRFSCDHLRNRQQCKACWQAAIEQAEALGQGEGEK